MTTAVATKLSPSEVNARLVAMGGRARYIRHHRYVITSVKRRGSYWYFWAEFDDVWRMPAWYPTDRVGVQRILDGEPE